MHQPLIIQSRFRGPPESGNGGYVSGAVAERFMPATSAIEVTLRAPIPLDTALDVNGDVTLGAADGLRVSLSDTLICEARHTDLELSVPAPPDFAAARRAEKNSASFTPGINPLIPDSLGFHPICFCCGADLPAEEGLHVHAAPLPDFDGVAAAWRPHASFAGADGVLPISIVWTALDCPGQFAWYAAGTKTGLLGRMTARVLAPVKADQNLLVTGWCIDNERSKYFAGTALFTELGTLCAYSKQVWIGKQD